VKELLKGAKILRYFSIREIINLLFVGLSNKICDIPHMSSVFTGGCHCHRSAKRSNPHRRIGSSSGSPRTVARYDEKSYDHRPRSLPKEAERHYWGLNADFFLREAWDQSSKRTSKDEDAALWPSMDAS
jgi:hypothetical protein